MSDEVKIEIVADAEASKALDKTKASVDGVGQAAAKAEPKITGLDTRLRGLGSRSDDTNRRTRDVAGGFDRAGEAADGFDTRAMGAADGFNAIKDASQGGSLSLAEWAMVGSDAGSSLYNTVIPSLKDATKNFGGFIQGATGAKTTLGGLGRAAVGAAGVAGVGFLVTKLIEAEEAAKALEVERLAEEFTALGKVDFSGLDILQGGVEKTFEKLLEQSPKLAQGYIDWMEAVSDGAAETEGFQERVDRAIDAQEGFEEATKKAKTTLELETEAVQELRDELDRLHGKTFDVADAQATITLGIADMAETVKASREEIGEQAASLDRSTEAGATNHQMLTDLISDQEDYIAALAESGLSNVDLAGKVNQSVLELEGQLLQMGFNREQVMIYTAHLKDVPRTVRTSIGVRNVEQSIHDVSRIRRELEALNGYTSYVRIVGTQVGVALPGGVRINAHGGLIGAATGGIHSSMRLVGEHGPELVSLPTGSMVHSNPDTERMLATAAGGGDRTLRIIIEGTGILNGIRREVFYDYGGDVQAALGAAT